MRSFSYGHVVVHPVHVHLKHHSLRVQGILKILIYLRHRGVSKTILFPVDSSLIAQLECFLLRLSERICCKWKNIHKQLGYAIFQTLVIITSPCYNCVEKWVQTANCGDRIQNHELHQNVAIIIQGRCVQRRVTTMISFLLNLAWRLCIRQMRTIIINIMLFSYITVT